LPPPCKKRPTLCLALNTIQMKNNPYHKKVRGWKMNIIKTSLTSTSTACKARYKTPCPPQTGSSSLTRHSILTLRLKIWGKSTNKRRNWKIIRLRKYRRFRVRLVLWRNSNINQKC
jgi:hypothetical protein